MFKRISYLLSAVIILLIMNSVAMAGTIQLPQSGQTQCYDTNGSVIACSGTGQDGAKRMGVAWPNPRFTVSGDCVTDNLTGLIWVKSPDSTLRTWNDAVSHANGLDLCGYTDWRLPNINELRSLVHSGYNEELCGGASCVYMSDWLNSKGFSNVQSDFYWSSTTYADGTSYAWFVGMWYGDVYCVFKTNYYHVWPVRGEQQDNPDSAYPANVWKTGQITSYTPGDDGDLEKGVAWPSPRFHDNGNGTVTDNLTGLVWLKNANCTDTVGGVTKGSGYLTWANALTWSNGLASGACGLADGSNAGDWRLPNREELESLIDFSRYNPALPAGHPFSSVQSTYYWSSTTYAGSTYDAWFVYMYNGFVHGHDKTDSLCVWPVRGGGIQPPSQPRFPFDSSVSYSWGPRMCDPKYPGDGEHKGHDIMAPETTDVYPICDGRVVGNYTHTELDKRYRTGKECGPRPNWCQYFNSFLIIKHNCNGQTIFGYYGHIKSDLGVGTDVFVSDNHPVGQIRAAYNYYTDRRDRSQDHLHLGINIKQKEYDTDHWGIAPLGVTCQSLQNNGWRDVKDYFGWKN